MTTPARERAIEAAKKDPNHWFALQRKAEWAKKELRMVRPASKGTYCAFRSVSRAVKRAQRHGKLPGQL